MDWPNDWTSEERARLSAFAQRAKRQFFGETVVLVTGVFDLLHEEHRKFLQKARAAGDRLLVAIESDVRVRALKGGGRPVQSQDVRLQNLQELSEVDAAVVLPEAFVRPEHYRAFIALVRPDILAVSSHSPHQEKKAEILRAYGGTLQVVHEQNPAVSTTILLQQQS